MKRDPLPAPAPKPATSLPPALAPVLALGPWNYYFLAKFVLFWRDLIGFNGLENLAFASVLLLPLPSSGWRRLRNTLAVPAAIALLYYDSWLPPVARVWSEAGRMSGFTLAYLAELGGRFISWPVLALLIICWVLYRIAAIYVRIGVLVLGTLVGLSLARPPASLSTTPAAAGGTAAVKAEKSLDTMLQQFFASESQRVVAFTKPADAAAPFDLVFIHICSLSWDDLQAVGLDRHPVFANVDVMLRQFNAASTYSGPAAIRINRATCGQTSHANLFEPVAQACQLMPSLEKIGFEPQLVFNHDGHFDDFLKMVQEQGIAAAPMALDGVAVPMRSFDNSPINGDLAVLTRWQETRSKNPAQRVAVYYNTVSLHDGNRMVGAPSRTSSDTYKERVATLLDDLQRFMNQLERSGRRTVVAIVPEHGAALRGDKRQISGLREIASPAITLVPVGIKVLGADARRLGDSVQITEPTSFLAVAHIVARLLEKSPYGSAGFAAADYTAGLPGTPFVAENETTVVMRRSGQTYFRQDKDEWKEYR